MHHHTPRGSSESRRPTSLHASRRSSRFLATHLASVRHLRRPLPLEATTVGAGGLGTTTGWPTRATHAGSHVGRTALAVAEGVQEGPVEFRRGRLRSCGGAAPPGCGTPTGGFVQPTRPHCSATADTAAAARPRSFGIFYVPRSVCTYGLVRRPDAESVGDGRRGQLCKTRVTTCARRAHAFSLLVFCWRRGAGLW